MLRHYIFSSLFLIITFLSSVVCAKPVTGKHSFTASSKLSEGVWHKIAVENNDVHQITYAELKKWGFTDPSKVAVYGFGGNIIDESFNTPHIDDLPEVAIFNDSENGRILFYGAGVVKWKYSLNKGYYHQNNHYSKLGYYFLYQKTDAPAVIDSKDDSNIDVSQYVVTDEYEDYFVYERDLESIGNTGREMYGESFNYTRTREFSFNIPGLTSNQGSITVDFIANNRLESSISGSINGVSFLDGKIKSIGSDNYQFATSFNNSSNYKFDASQTQKIRLTYNPNGGSLKHSNLNYIRLNVVRKLNPYSGSTLFRSNKHKNIKYSVADNSYSSRVMVWDISDKVNIKRCNISSESGRLYFYGNGGNEYALVDRGGSFPGVSYCGTVANQNLHALSQIDMVVLAAPKLQQQAKRLAKFRQENDGLKVIVVTPEQIYNEFSSGTPDATAYRLFMKMFYDRSVTLGNPPGYLLLMGDGANDNRGMNQSVWSPSVLENCLLTYQSENSLNETESYVCDDYFGFLDDNEGGKTDGYGLITLKNDVLDIGIGRFPVRTASQAKTMVDKLIAYTQNNVVGSWKNNLLFLGDDGDRNTHMVHADSMVRILENQNLYDFNFTKIYLDAYKRITTATGTAYPDAKKEFFEQLNSGALLVNFSGHGSTTSITHEMLFTLADAENIKMKKLPVWVTATCDFSRFDHPSTAAGEALVLNPDGGAIAMFTTTRIVYSDGNYKINRELIKNIFDKNSDGTRYRIGDIMKEAKNALGSNSNKLNFTLLGDPSLKLAYPEYKMAVTHINDKEISPTEEVQFKAMEHITIKGNVMQLAGSEIQEDFTGLVYPTLYDAEEKITAVDNDGTGSPFVFRDRTRKLFSGCDSIVNGKFEFSFIVPKDISYSMNSGMLNLYGYSKDRREAQGFFNKYIVGGTSDEVIEDTNGPIINYLFLNSTSFKNGDIVNSTPYLHAAIEDETGINATGSVIGHDITITIYGEDNSRERYVLNNYFITNPGNSSSGTINYSIPELKNGKYTLELKVWDILNNSSTAQIEFIVDNNAKPVIFDLKAQQNPVRDEARFLLSHNRPETNINAKIQVFTQMGQLVYEKDMTATTEYMDTMPIIWDLKTSSGSRVMPGIYIYRAYISSDGQNYTSKSKKLVVLGR